MNSVYLSLGSNLGNRKENIESALIEIEKGIGPIKKRSSNYYSEAHGFKSKNEFLNIVIQINTNLSPFEVLEQLISIEKLLGREHKSVNNIYSDRIIDIDILYFNDLILNTSNLTIPHPKIHERDFILIPLNEIFSEFDKSV